jgi:hypothetical protein
MSIFEDLGRSQVVTILNKEQMTPLDDKTLNQSRENVFVIKYIDNETEKDNYFNFALLPAIEATSNRGQNGVPEVKPGVVTMTNMKYKNFLVPGSTPVIQTIGVQSTMHQFVGAFIGSENIAVLAKRASLNHVYRLDGMANPPYNDTDNAFMKAKLFDRKVVQSGRPITMTLTSDVSYTYEGVVVGFKFYTVRADRAYYTLDVLTTVYPHQKPPVDSTQFRSDGAKRGESPSTDIPTTVQDRVDNIPAPPVGKKEEPTTTPSLPAPPVGKKEEPPTPPTSLPPPVTLPKNR